MKNKLIIISCLLLSFNLFAQEPQDVVLANKYKKLEIKEIPLFITSLGGAPEAVSLNHDGSQFGYIAAGFESTKLYPSNLYLHHFEKEETKKFNKRGKFLNIETTLTYMPNNTLVVSELEYRPLSIIKTLAKVVQGEEIFPHGYHSALKFYAHNGKKIKEYSAKDLGLSSNKEFIQHPRISPNGKWLTFYIKGKVDKPGIYLTNLETMKTIKLSEGKDKHPTWTAEGDKILFHTQNEESRVRGAEENEQAYLGYFQLILKNDKVESQRIMIDDMKKEGFTFHKHPALYPGTDLLFFHGQMGPGKNKKLFVRKLQPGSKIYKLEILNPQGEEFKKVKHPATSFDAKSGLLFIAKSKTDKDYSIFKLNPEFIQELKKLE